jgi:hypothetical protein
MERWMQRKREKYRLISSIPYELNYPYDILLLLSEISMPQGNTDMNLGRRENIGSYIVTDRCIRYDLGIYSEILEDQLTRSVTHRDSDMSKRK